MSLRMPKKFSYENYSLIDFNTLQVGPRIYGRYFSKQDLHNTAKKGLERMPKVIFNLY